MRPFRIGADHLDVLGRAADHRHGVFADGGDRALTGGVGVDREQGGLLGDDARAALPDAGVGSARIHGEILAEQAENGAEHGVLEGWEGRAGVRGEGCAGGDSCVPEADPEVE